MTVSLFKAPNMQRIEDKEQLTIHIGSKVWAKTPKGYLESADGRVPDPKMFSVDRESEQAKKLGDYVQVKETTTNIDGRRYPVLETSVYRYYRPTGDPYSSAPIADLCNYRDATVYDPKTRLKLRETTQIGDQRATNYSTMTRSTSSTMLHCLMILTCLFSGYRRVPGSSGVQG